MADENVVFVKDNGYVEEDLVWWSSKPILYFEHNLPRPLPAKCVSCQKQELPMTAFQSADEGFHPIWICLPCLQDIVSEVENLQKGSDDEEH